MQDAYGSTALMIRRLRTAQAIIGFLKRQYVERNGDTSRFFAGCFGFSAMDHCAVRLCISDPGMAP